MQKKIIILDADPSSSRELSGILNSKSYPCLEVQALSTLEGLFDSEQIAAVVIDIDSVRIDNRMIRDMALKHRSVRFLCTSKDRFHPELKDAICYHIYACLNKPVDPDELLYWIKSIYEEEEIPDT